MMKENYVELGSDAADQEIKEQNIKAVAEQYKRIKHLKVKLALARKQLEDILAEIEEHGICITDRY